MSYKISVIVPTLTNEEGVRYLINYFKEKKEYQLIIIQNAKVKSQNENLKFKINNRNIVYLPQERNLGYARANNLGVKYAKAEWLLLLNDDIEFKIKSSIRQLADQNSKLPPKTAGRQNQNLKPKTNKNENQIEELLKIAKKNNLDAVAPVLVNDKGEIENLGYQVLPYGKINLIKNSKFEYRNPKQIKNSNDQNFKHSNNLNLENSDLFRASNLEFRISPIDGLTAACLLIKRSIFEKLGGFDESFFAYLEDVDLFLRLKKAGYKFALVPDIVVFHHHRKTSSKMGCFKQRQDVINWWRLFFKHPDIIRFSPAFLVERARNVWGLIKCVMCNV